jgi:hypothetical protein
MKVGHSFRVQSDCQGVASRHQEQEDDLSHKGETGCRALSSQRAVRRAAVSGPPRRPAAPACFADRRTASAYEAREAESLLRGLCDESVVSLCGQTVFVDFVASRWLEHTLLTPCLRRGTPVLPLDMF